MNPSRQSDARLLTAADRGNADAFGVLYSRYVERLHGYHLRRCRDDEAALDLVSETFAQAWLARGSFRDLAGGSAGPWLFGIARNVLLMSVKRGRLEDTARQRLGMQERADADRVAPEPSWLDGADELLDALPPEHRRALELRIVEDLSYDQVAARLRTTPQNARVRVHRALSVLRARHADLQENR